MVDSSGAFEFPTLHNTFVFTTHEYGTVELPYTLLGDTCTVLDNHDITVFLIESAKVRCKIRLRNDTCYASELCFCNGKGTFNLTKTASREDNGDWVWQITDRTTRTVTANTTIYFNVTYPARVTTLTLQNPLQPAAQDDQVHVANPGDRIQVNCSVEAGNPPVTARLLDRHGTELQTQKDDGKTDTVDLKYDFPSVSCDHAGIITCEAKGSENKTTTLLVRCLPTIEFQDNEINITDGGSADLNFTIRTHSRNVTCSLTRLDATEATRDCSFLTVTGFPPDLTVSVRLDNVRRQDQGTWRLNLTNDAGSGCFTFNLTVLKITTSTNTSNTPPNGNKNNGASPEHLPYVFVGVAALAALVAITVSLVMCFVRRRNLGAKMRRYLATQRAGIEAPRNEDEEDQEDSAHNANGGSEERLMMPNVLPSTPPVRHGARQNRYVATPGDSRHEGGAAPDRESCKPTSAGLDKNEDYVDIEDIKERKRQAWKEREASGLDGRQARSTATTGTSNHVDVNADGLLYVQLDFSGRTTRNVMFRTLPRTDYAEVSFKDSPPPPGPLKIRSD